MLSRSRDLLLYGDYPANDKRCVINLVTLDLVSKV